MKLKRSLGVVSSTLAFIAAARVIVLFSESFATVRGERIADRDLIKLCESGQATLSVDFRSLCLKKHAERSAPLLLKALLRACSTAFSDFAEHFSSPARILLLFIFCATGVAAPLVKMVLSVALQQMRMRRARVNNIKYAQSDSDEDDHHEIVMLGGHEPLSTRQRLTTSLRRSARQLAGHSRRISFTDEI